MIILEDGIDDSRCVTKRRLIQVIDHECVTQKQRELFIVIQFGTIKNHFPHILDYNLTFQYVIKTSADNFLGESSFERERDIMYVTS